MPISVTCECGRILQAKDEYAGHRTNCPSCGRDLLIPPVAGVPPGPATGPGQPLPGYYGPPRDESRRTSGKAITSLVLGLFSPFCCVFTGIPGLILGVMGLKEIEASDGRLQGKGIAIGGLVLSGLATLGALVTIPLYIGLLVPAVMGTNQAAARARCMNNLKQIGLAMHNYHDGNGRFPARAIVAADGTPLLSWRVAILPLIGQDGLYRQFHLDEPWDSPHNLTLLPLMPAELACPADLTSPTTGLTRYQVIAGPGTLFDPDLPDGATITAISDGTSNTLLVIEAQAPVEWTRPGDVAYAPDGPVPVLDSSHPGGANVLFADGSVRFLSSGTAEPVLRSLITRGGGEVVPPY